MEARLERLNINVPSSTRATLKHLAKAQGKREAEVARELLVKAARDARRQEMIDQVRRAMTPELKARMLKLAERMERLRADEG